MEAEFGKIGREARLGTGDAEIGRYRKSQPAADGRAVDGGDDRLLVAEDAHRLDIEVVDRQVGRRIGLRALFLLLPRRIAEIGAGAERLALCGENGSPDFDLAVELLQRIGDLVDQGNVEEIQRRLADLDQADMTVPLDADVRKFAHVFVSDGLKVLLRRKWAASPTQRGLTRVGHLDLSKPDISGFDGSGLGG